MHCPDADVGVVGCDAVESGPANSVRPLVQTFAWAHADEHLALRYYQLQPDWTDIPPWFEDKMARFNLEAPSSRGAWDDGARTDFHIVGLMRVTHRGATWNHGPLTAWNAEGEMLMKTYHQPIDGGIIKIVDAVELSEPFLVKEREKIEALKNDGHVRQLPRMFVFLICARFVCFHL